MQLKYMHLENASITPLCTHFHHYLDFLFDLNMKDYKYILFDRDRV